MEGLLEEIMFWGLAVGFPLMCIHWARSIRIENGHPQIWTTDFFAFAICLDAIIIADPTQFTAHSNLQLDTGSARFFFLLLLICACRCWFRNLYKLEEMVQRAVPPADIRERYNWAGACCFLLTILHLVIFTGYLEKIAIELGQLQEISSQVAES